MNLKDIRKKGKVIEGGSEGAEIYLLKEVVYKIQHINDLDLDKALPILKSLEYTKLPNVVDIYAHWVEDDYLIICMEKLSDLTEQDFSLYDLDTIYMDSEDTLEGLKIALKNISDPYLIEVFSSVQKGMEQLGYTHYDINLDNTMLDKDGNYKIIDLF